MDKYGRDEVFYLIADGREKEALAKISQLNNVNISDKDGYSYLHIAVQSGLLSVVKLLLEKGANIEIVDKYGKTPLCVAIAIYDMNTENRVMIDYLLEKGANLDHMVNSGVSCRKIALMKGLKL